MTAPGRWRRGAAVLATAAGSVLVAAPPAAAHPIGGRSDLPVPPALFAAVAGVTLVVTFVALNLRWRQPRLQAAAPPRSVARMATVVTVLKGVGLGGLLLVVVAGLGGGTGRTNLAPLVVFIGFWLVVPFLSPLVGDWWRWLSPWGTLERRVNRHRTERPHLVETYGVWPAAGSLLLFAWVTLVAPAAAQPAFLAGAALGYTALVVAAGRWAGPETGLRLVDGFHTSNALFGAIAPWAVEADGDGPAALTHRGWLRGLARFPEWPGLPALVATLIGAVAFDGLTGSELWIDVAGSLRHETWFATAVLVGTVALVVAAVAAASWWAARLVGGDESGRRVARRYAHVLVPVALAFMVSHYLTLVLYEGQLVLSSLSDPFALGWDLFGSADRRIVIFLSPTAVALLQVTAMAGGQALALVLAHDRALADYGAARAPRIQYAMVTLVVGFTSLGLFLLSG